MQNKRIVVFVGLISMLYMLSGFITTIDISIAFTERPAPFIDSTCTLGGNVKAVTISGALAYVGTGTQLEVLDIADPSNPVSIGCTDSLSGAIENIAIANGLAYVAAGGAGLRIVDISIPTVPSEVGFVDTPGYSRGIDVSGNYAYVADETGDLRIVDVSIPTTPAEIAALTLDGTAFDVVVEGSYAFVASATSGLRVVDVSVPSTPVEASFVDTPGNSRGLSLSGSYAYVADGATGLRIIDIANPTIPTEIGSASTTGSAYDSVVAESTAYMASGDAGLEEFDVSDPVTPVRTDVIDTPGSARGLDIVTGYAYVADYDNGLVVIELGATSLPSPILTTILNSDMDGNYTVGWSTVVDATGYELEEQQDSGSWNQIYDGVSTSQAISGRPNGSWCYRVRAKNGTTTSGWSATQCTTVLVLTAPTLNAIVNSDMNGNYSVSWSTVVDATRYELEEQQDGGSWNQIYGGASTSQAISGRPNGSWCYRVRAKNGTTTSNWSTTQCVQVNVITSYSVFVPLVLIDSVYMQGTSEIEPNNTREEAITNKSLQCGTEYQAYDDDHDDYYALLVIASGNIEIWVEGHQSEIGQVQLLQEGENDPLAIVGEPPDYHINEPVISPGLYFVRVVSESTQSDEPYSIWVNYPCL